MSLPKTYGLFRLTRDSELRFSSEGKPILKMGLVASEKYADRETQCFIDATVFGKQAEIISQYAGEKGTQIFLTGKLQTETWVDKDSGQNRSKHSMIVEGFDFVSKPKGNVENNSGGYANGSDEANRGVNAPTHYEKKPMPKNNSLPEIDIDSEEIPF